MPANDDCAILHGQVVTALSLRDLQQALSDGGIAARVGESSHYTTGYYVGIRSGSVSLEFEKITATEYLVGGDGDSVEEMRFFIADVSRILLNLRLKHRFEIYFPHDHLAAYLHYDWPQI